MGAWGVLEDDRFSYVKLKRNGFLTLPEAPRKQNIDQHFLRYVRKINSVGDFFQVFLPALEFVVCCAFSFRVVILDMQSILSISASNNEVLKDRNWTKILCRAQE
jgi:hypothetical protein